MEDKTSPTLDEKIELSLDEMIDMKKNDRIRERRERRRRSRSRSPSKPYNRPSDRTSRSPSPERRVYVGNIPWKSTWQDLKDHMKTVGSIEFVNIFQKGNISRGCGVVVFSTAEGAKRAIDELNDTTIKGSDRPIFIREDRENSSSSLKTNPNSDRGDRHNRDRRDRYHDNNSSDKVGRQLFVDNLPFSTTWQDLKDRFKLFGSVESANILKGRDGRSAGKGTVLFFHSSDMRKAIREADRSEFQGRTMYLKEDQYV